MKLRSSHLPPYLLVSLTTCAVIPASLCEGSEEPDKVLIFDDIDSSPSLPTPEQLEKMLPQKKSPSPLCLVPISYCARVEEDWEMVSILAKRSCRGRGMLPWEQPENFVRPFVKGSSVSHRGKAKYQASKQKSKSIRTRRLAQ